MIARVCIIFSFLTLGAVTYAGTFDGAVSPIPARTNTISIGWVGDMVPSNPTYNKDVFVNVRERLLMPDLMMGNLEGTFAIDQTASKCSYIQYDCYAFSGDASFADALKNAGFDFISLVNNHAFDYGSSGLDDTTRELDRVGIPYITSINPSTSIFVKGNHIGIVGLSSTEPTQTINDYTFIKDTVTYLKKNNNYVIVIFHGGSEGANKTSVPGTTEYFGTENRGNVELVAHTAIDAGADLVLGAGPHVLRKIELYKDIPIAYSLGNFVGGDHHLITTGTLALSGIFTTQFGDTAPMQYNFTSVILSGEGAPRIDSQKRSQKLLKTL